MKEFPSLLQFRRSAVPKIWGGRRLSDWLRLGEERPIGETWEVFDRGSRGSSIVSTGAWKDRSLAELMSRDAPALLGNAAPDPFGRFPLMLKFLDASRDLSLQVHPDDELARELGIEDSGKSEAWVVLPSEPDARLVRGLAAGHEARELIEALRSGCDPWPMLASFPVSEGDVVEVPAGTLHCVCRGTMLYEIQQNSDITFRLFDWGRTGPDGRSRELHVDEAERAMGQACGARPSEPTPGIPDEEGAEILVECPAFVLRRFRTGATTRIETGGFCQLLTLVKGSAGVRSGSQGIELSEGASCLATGRARGLLLEPLRGQEVVALLVRPSGDPDRDREGAE